MKHLFWQMMLTLDGFTEGPNGELDWHVVDDDFNRYVLNMLKSVDAILLGRVTYQALAGYWPSSTDAEASLMNALPKIVFSRTLAQTDWRNSRIVRTDIADEVARMKRGPGRGLALFGSADLASTLLRLGQIDEIRVLLNPVVLGAGRPMFKDLEERMALKLTKTETLSSGTVILCYEPR